MAIIAGFQPKIYIIYLVFLLTLKINLFSHTQCHSRREIFYPFWSFKKSNHANISFHDNDKNQCVVLFSFPFLGGGFYL